LIIGRGQPGRAVGKDVDGDRGFTVQAAYDARNLTLTFDVKSPHPLLNGVDDPTVIFKGGNLLDIQLATDPAADPKREKPAPGDLRLLVSRQQGQTVAVLFRPRVEKPAGERIVLRSPTGEEAFDLIEVREDIGLRVTERDGGFTAIVTVPLATLGWQPRAGESVRLDLGYIFGNSGGTAAAVRAYWRNNGFTANVVGDIPNESRLEPSLWGTALVE
jgi:hypothetical protein